MHVSIHSATPPTILPTFIMKLSFVNDEPLTSAVVDSASNDVCYEVETTEDKSGAHSTTLRRAGQSARDVDPVCGVIEWQTGDGGSGTQILISGQRTSLEEFMKSGSFTTGMCVSSLTSAGGGEH